MWEIGQELLDVKMAQWKVNGEIWEVVDLPGSYSLLGKNADEQVTSSFLLSQEYDVILMWWIQRL